MTMVIKYARQGWGGPWLAAHLTWSMMRAWEKDSWTTLPCPCWQTRRRAKHLPETQSPVSSTRHNSVATGGHGEVENMWVMARKFCNRGRQQGCWSRTSQEGSGNCPWAWTRRDFSGADGLWRIVTFFLKSLVLFWLYRLVGVGLQREPHRVLLPIAPTPIESARVFLYWVRGQYKSQTMNYVFVAEATTTLYKMHAWIVGDST